MLNYSEICVYILRYSWSILGLCVYLKALCSKKRNHARIFLGCLTLKFLGILQISVKFFGEIPQIPQIEKFCLILLIKLYLYLNCFENLNLYFFRFSNLLKTLISYIQPGFPVLLREFAKMYTKWQIFLVNIWITRNPWLIFMFGVKWASY